MSESGRFDEAIDRFRKLLAERPGFQGAREGLGQALRRKGDHAGAAEAFGDALEADTDNPQLRDLLAQEWLALGRDEDAAQEFHRVLERRPGSASAHNGLAVVHQRRGEWTQALTHFERAAQAAPDNPAIRNSVASVQRQLDRWEDAEANYQRVLSIDGKFAPAHHGLGFIHRHRDEHAKALASFERAVALAPQDPCIRLEAAMELHALGRSADHLAALRSLVEEFPQFAPGFDRLAGALRRAGCAGEALSAISAATALEPSNPWFRCTRGEILLELGLPDDARVEFEQTLRLCANFAPALSGLGRLAQTRGDRAAALAAFQAAAAAEPQNPWFATAIGEELAAADRFDEAETALAAVLERHPGFAPSHNARGILARRRGDAAAAAASFEAAVAADPPNLWYRLSAASALDAAGRDAEAEVAYSEILASDSDFAGAHNGLGDIYRRRGDHLRAEVAFTAAARIEPANVWYQLSLAGTRLTLRRWEEARAAYSQILGGRPDFAPALHGLGQVLAQMGDHDGALDALRKAVVTEPTNPWIRNALVVELRELRRFEEAEQAARENVALHPNAAIPLIELANCLRQGAPAEVVLLTLRQAVALEPDNANARCALAFECLRQWRLAEAETLYDAVLERAPGFVDAWIGKGLIARCRGETDLAIAHFEAAVRNGPSSWAQAELAQEHTVRGEFAIARAVLKSAMEAAGDDLRLLMQFGYLERAAGDRSAAAAAFAKARAQYPRFVPACVEGRREAQALGRTTEALELLGVALRLDPNDEGAVEALAQVLQCAGREGDALAVFERAAAIHSASIPAQLGAARIEARLGRLDRAVTIIDGLHACWGPRPEFFATKAALLRDAGFYEDAARVLDEGLARLSEPPMLLHERAALAIQCGDLALATRLIDRLQAADGGRPQTWLLAQAAAARWDFARALAHVREAIAAAPADTQRLAFATKAALAVFDVDAAEASLRAEAAANRSASQLRGQPTHPLESHFGHLMWEWRLEGEALVRSRLALADAASPVDALCALVRQFPDYTPTALALLVELRRGKQLTTLDEARLTDGARRIPRRIAQFWDQAELPTDLARLSDTWRDNNPAHEYQLFSAGSALEWLQARRLSDAARAFVSTREPAQKADLFRLAWLAEEGGYWADIDDRCVAPIDLIDPGGRDLVVYQEDIGSTGADFLGAVAGHPLIALALRAAVRAIQRRDGDIPWLSTGPGLLTRIFASAAVANLDAFLGPGGPLILERWELFAAVRIRCSAAYKHTPNHWVRAAFDRKTQNLAPRLDELLSLTGLRARFEPQTSSAA